MRELALGLSYPQALERAGAMPVILPPLLPEAIDLLNDYLTDLTGTKLEPSQVVLLRRPVDSRIKMFQLMRDQKALAAGAPADRLTQEVRAALRRLEKRQSAGR